MKWNDIVRNVQYSSAGISIFLNILLTFLILLKSPKQMGTYKYLMVYLAWFETSYSIIDIIVSPTVYLHGSAYVIFVNQNESIFEKETLRFLLALWSGFFGFSIGIFVLPFYYRYLVAVGSNILKTLNDWRLLLWFTFPMVYGIIWHTLAYVLLRQTDEKNEYVRSAILLDLDMNIDDIALIGPYFYHKTGDGKYEYDIKSISAISSGCVMVAISVTAIVYFGVNCYQKMKLLMNNTSKYRNLQNQLFNALLIEAIIPLILIHIPVSMLFLFTFFEMDVGTMADTLSVTAALFPAVDPLPTIFIVKNYRTTILNFFRCSKSSNMESPAVEVQATEIQITC